MEPLPTGRPYEDEEQRVIDLTILSNTSATLHKHRTTLQLFMGDEDCEKLFQLWVRRVETAIKKQAGGLSRAEIIEDALCEEIDRNGLNGALRLFKRIWRILGKDGKRRAEPVKADPKIIVLFVRLIQISYDGMPKADGSRILWQQSG